MAAVKPLDPPSGPDLSEARPDGKAAAEDEHAGAGRAFYSVEKERKGLGARVRWVEADGGSHDGGVQKVELEVLEPPNVDRRAHLTDKRIDAQRERKRKN